MNERREGDEVKGIVLPSIDIYIRSSKEARSDRFSYIFDRGFAGILFHESLRHFFGYRSAFNGDMIQ